MNSKEIKRCVARRENAKGIAFKSKQAQDIVSCGRISYRGAV